MRHKSVLVALVATALAITGCGRGDGASATPGVNTETKTISLGALTAISGPAAVVGKPVTDGGQAYVNWVNENGGMAGYKLELLVRDTQLDAQQTVTQYGQIADGVAGLVQVLGTGAVRAVQQDLAADGMLATPTTLDAAWYADPQLVPFLPPYQVQAIDAVEYYAANLGEQGGAFCTLTSADAFGTTMADGVRFAGEKLSLQMPAAETFSLGDKEFSAQLGRMQAAGCDAVWLGALFPEFATILGQAAGRGFAPTWMSTTYNSAMVTTALAPYLKENLVVSTLGVQWGDTSVPGMRDLIAAQQKWFPAQQPDPYFVFGWMQARAVAQVIEAAAAKGDLSRAGIKAALDGIGTLTFDGLVPDLPYGAPSQRQVNSATTFFGVSPDALASSGGLTVLAPAAQNFSGPVAAQYIVERGIKGDS